MTVTTLPICGIYKITCSADERCYVGQSIDIVARWGKHKRTLRQGKHRSIFMQRAWDKHGEDTFAIEVLEEVDPPTLLLNDLKTLLTEREQVWMDRLHPEFNVAPAAGSTLGMRPSEEAKVNWRKVIDSPEHREKLRAASKKRWERGPVSDETKAKMSAVRKGRKLPPRTAEARANASVAANRRWEDPEQREKMRTTTNAWYASKRAQEEATG